VQPKRVQQHALVNQSIVVTASQYVHSNQTKRRAAACAGQSINRSSSRRRSTSTAIRSSCTTTCIHFYSRHAMVTDAQKGCGASLQPPPWLMCAQTIV
jgi:hypothetical protein